MLAILIDGALLVALVASALWAVLTPSLIRSVFGLALASVAVTLLLFRLRSPLAAVFELSVCAGLVSAIFLGAISLMSPETAEDVTARNRERIARYWYLPVLLLAVGLPLVQLGLPDMPLAAPSGPGVREVLWNVRHLDLVGQIAILLAGAFGVVVLFKERKNER